MSRLWMSIAAAAAAALLPAPANAQKELPDGEGKTLLQNVCGTNCHKVDFVTTRRLSRDEWYRTVEAMAKKGADATDDQFLTIIDYLAKNFPPAKDAGQGSADSGEKLHVNKATSEKLASFLGISGPEAAAIVRYREANGNFKAWQDLKKVPGIDYKKIEAKKDRLSF
jgi:competence ComEA-like helix-hairpin-helix protein